MKEDFENSLPKKLNGTVHIQYVKCGKKACKCLSGERHGPYYYHFVRVGGKLRKRYLKLPEIEPIQIACAERQRENREKRAESERFWKKLRGIRQELREIRKKYGKFYR